MVVGELAALLTTESDPVAEPAEVGAKIRVNAVFVLAEIVAGKERPVMLKSAPVTFA